MTLVRTLVLGAAVVFLGTATAQDAKQPAKLDPAKVLGSYTFAEGVKDGDKVPADHLKALTLAVTKDQMVMKTPDGDFKFKYTIDASKSPARIDLEITDGPIGKGAKSKGIIALDGDTLKLAYSPDEGERPKDFDCKKGSKAQCFTLKKADEKKK
ncbi:MAG: TIGR03067 domain-containing protein [Gemmataceae bacterium]|nr:TIGR03067 domain-containing protein [Gemmataceae bacterium]